VRTQAFPWKLKIEQKRKIQRKNQPQRLRRRLTTTRPIRRSVQKKYKDKHKDRDSRDRDSRDRDKDRDKVLLNKDPRRWKDQEIRSLLNPSPQNKVILVKVQRFKRNRKTGKNQLVEEKKRHPRRKQWLEIPRCGPHQKRPDSLPKARLLPHKHPPLQNNPNLQSQFKYPPLLPLLQHLRLSLTPHSLPLVIINPIVMAMTMEGGDQERRKVQTGSHSRMLWVQYPKDLGIMVELILVLVAVGLVVIQRPLAIQLVVPTLVEMPLGLG